MKRRKTKLYVIDSETDPFLRGRVPSPFAWDLYDGSQHWTTWGDDCTKAMMNIVDGVEPGIVYVHNGGKFDFYFLLPYFSKHEEMLIIKDRIVEASVPCALGLHKFRDSYKLLPFSLDTYQKTKIDYDKFERDVRETHKDEIISYLHDDCAFLYQLVAEYWNTFGQSLTIGSTAMKELKKFYDVGTRLKAGQDAMIRPYFFGGRVERYQTGCIQGDWKVFDVNSMYPYVMRDFDHPIGEPEFGDKVTERTFFLKVRGHNRGAFPYRDGESVRFDTEYGEYLVSIHEYNTACEIGRFDPECVIETIDFAQSTNFGDYIDHYYGLRKTARVSDDKIHELFYKFLLNNSYGKFATNPENFKEYRLTDMSQNLSPEFELAYMIEDFGLIFWTRPTEEVEYMNIGTGASITGASRSVLMRGLHAAVNPVYCDTDSIICEELPLDVDATRLGAWKLEKTGNRIDIAGRKMYALWKGSECVKAASKGVRVPPEWITEIADGREKDYLRDAPTFRLGGNVDWIKRTIRRT